MLEKEREGHVSTDIYIPVPQKVSFIGVLLGVLNTRS